mmetsp:Transcript_12969/g.55349  ORF Transcript_12969/g.55349 Transcript_12969/m.55349 type:complete len:385 (-) Transcript_12969:1793-2947(-)
MFFEATRKVVPNVVEKTRLGLFLFLCLLFTIFSALTGVVGVNNIVPNASSHVEPRDSGVRAYSSKTGEQVECLVLYSYYEPNPAEERSTDSDSNTAPGIARKNLRFFIQNGVLGPHAPSAQVSTFVFIINGGFVSEPIPDHLSNVHVLKRPNIGFEFCGVSEALEIFEGRYFIILNSSVRGPFLPSYFPVKVPWTEAVHKMLSNTVKLSGVSINCHCCSYDQADCKVACSDADSLYNLHVQSFFLVTDATGLEIIRPALACHNSKVDAIERGEIMFTRLILEAGFNIASMSKFWYGHDFRNLTSTASMCAAVAMFSPKTNGDTQYAKSYFAMDHHPYEDMFIKTNRGEFPAHQLYTRWSQKTNSRLSCYSEEEIPCAARETRSA